MKKITIGLGLLIMSSCSKYLDKSPDSTWTELNTPQKVSQLLGTAYPQANYIVFSEAMSDNVTDKGVGQVERTNQDPYFFDVVQNINEDSPEFYWTACYKAIAAANNALKACEHATDTSLYQAQKGEALVARAYAHFMLVTFFSKFYDPATAAKDPGIPYVTEPETVVFQKYDRNTVAYVYEMIEKDLLAGLPLIDDESYDVPHYHFNKSAAHAFATRFYLYKKEYERVVEFANKAFPNNDLAGYMRPWNTTYSAMSPQLLYETYARASEKCNLLLAETQSLCGRYNGRYRFGMDYAINRQILAFNVTNGRWVYPVYYYGNNDYFVPKLSEYFVKASVNATIGDPYVMVPLFTTEEVLFNRAEANLYLKNNAAVLSDLNLFASKRITNYDAAAHAVTIAKAKTFYGTGLSDMQALLNTILDFKRAEYVQEGHRWFDLQRYGVSVTHADIRGNKTTVPAGDDRRVLQIPLSAQTSGLTLNPR